MSPAPWPAVGVDGAREWEPRSALRLPLKDRNVIYRPSLPGEIAPHTPELSTPTVQLLTEATMALRSSDDRNTGRSVVALLRSESAASSKIEHIEVGQRYIARALAGLPTKQRSAREVAANLNALQLALDSADQPITGATIDAIHKRLLPEEGWSGSIRTVQNWIGGSDRSPRDARHVPPAPEHVGRLVADLVTFMNRTDLPALAQAAISHAQFETIHPYADGNGRVGRCLTHLVLRVRGVTPTTVAPLSITFLADRDAYLGSLSTYESGDVDRYVAGFARSAQIAAAASDRLSADLARVVEDWWEIPQVARSRRDAVIRRIVPDLPAHPVTDAAAAAGRYGVSVQAARNALDVLADLGVLNQTTAARNLQIYETPEVFAAVEDIERDVRSGTIA